MSSTDIYVDLITNEHNDKPNFVATIRALTSGAVDNINLDLSLPAKFDLDQAVGVQLDDVGRWVGVTRRLSVPITGVYFTWDDTVTTGWDSGIWQGDFDPTTGLVSLPDDVYRILLRGKIAANNWDGTIPGAVAVWSIVFNGGQTIVIQDNQDMSMIVGFVGPPLSAVERALLTGGYLPLKPAAVRIAYFAIPVNDGPIFAWDADTDVLAGWDEGSWALEILPT
jgi:hypothetical protein